jgi:RND family efflux transporter MFP subunit
MFITARRAAVVVTLTVAAVWLWAHEGHDSLPTKGATPLKDSDGNVTGVVLAPESLRALDVHTADVTAGGLDEHLSAPATVIAAWQGHAFVTSRLSGKVAALHVQPGQAVAHGQIVAEVESLELADLQRELSDARNEAELSGKTMKDLEAAAKKGAVPEPDALEAKARHRQDLDNLDVVRRKLLGLGVPADFVDRLARDWDAKPIRTLPIRSLIGGVVAHVDVGLGQGIEPGTHLLEVLNLSKMWVRIAVLEKDLQRVAMGQRVELRFPVTPPQGGTWTGTIGGVGRALEERTMCGAVWVSLDNAGDRLLPGMAGVAHIILPATRPGLLLPTAALLTEGAERYVLVEIAPGQYRRQNIVVERQTSDTLEVRRGPGLFPGDRVVTEGGHELATIFPQHVLRLSREAAAGLARGRGLELGRPERRTVADTVRLPAVVDLPPSGRALVSARLAGTLLRLTVERDQSVAAGDVLAEVFSPEFLNLQLDFLRASTQTQLLEERVNRLRPSADSTAVPSRTFREAESAYLAARQRRDSLRAKLRELGLTAADLTALVEKRAVSEVLPVRTPIAGTVVGLRTTLGHAVKPEDGLIEIHNLAAAVLRVDVPERQWSAVRAGQAARVRLVAESGFVGDAKVIRTGPAVGDVSRTIPAWVQMTQLPRTPLLPGMMAGVTLIVGEPGPTLSVPVESIQRDGGNAYLFVRGSDGVFERRRVEAGRADDRFVEILSGWDEVQDRGKEIVVRGVAELQTAWSSVQ